MKVLFGLVIAGLVCSALLYVEEDIVESLALRIMGEEREPIPTFEVTPSDFRLVVPTRGELVGLKTVPVRVPSVRTGALNVSWLLDVNRPGISGDSIS